MTIVKVQIPVASNVSMKNCLIYDRDREHVTEDVNPPLYKRMRKRKKIKAFFEATWMPLTFTWSVGKEAPEQDW